MAMMSFVCGLGGVLLFTILAPALQAIARRTGSSVAPVALLAIAAVISHITCVVLGAVNLQHFQYWNTASIFASCVTLYVFAFGAVYKSVSLEILLDLAQRPERLFSPISSIARFPKCSADEPISWSALARSSLPIRALL
jgi:hypothetical protein